MKLIIAIVTLISSISSSQGHLRGPSTTLEEQDNLQSHSSVTGSACLIITDESQCNTSKDETGSSCVWCKCAAVPSECVSVEEAKKLPTGVFDCATPPDSPEISPVDTAGTADTSKTTIITAARTDDKSSDSKYDGKFLNYSLTDDEVDGNLCDPTSKSLSGYVDITGSKYDADGEDKHLFYWFFEKRSGDQEEVKSNLKDEEEIPLILWLTGGPGCSSTLALLTENGPCSVNDDGTSTEINPYSWTEAAHVLWLDQPAGVGFSYGKENDYNEEMISEDAFYFLQTFLTAHPEYSESPLYVTGESYGGHYAPAIAHKVWSKNNNNDESLLKINLAGLAVGNGLTDPIEQYKWYPEMAYHNSHGIKTISEKTYNTMKSSVATCVALIDKCNGGDSFLNRFACQSAFVACNLSLTSPYQMTGLNPYDIRKQCEKRPLCYDFSSIEKWLNSESTKAALHVKDDTKWATCNMGINLKFHTDWMKDFSPFVSDLINAGIPALIYAGDVDFICNYLGNQAWTLGLDWDHKDEFNNVEVKEWGSHEDGSAAGLVRSSNGFTFMQVYDAGHMVPSDQPDVALEMIKTFVQGKSF